MSPGGSLTFRAEESNKTDRCCRLPLYKLCVPSMKEVHVGPVMPELSTGDHIRQPRVFIGSGDLLQVLVSSGRKSLAISEVLITCGEGTFGRHLLACRQGNPLVMK